ncbi:MAG: hypothetical protein KA028_01575 [Candidatus Pacebacteria bacterium]|nr:hypothetical protein [Candidatus Paceibacterota bacterium]
MGIVNIVSNCLLVFIVVGTILYYLGYITTKVGPMIIQLATAITGIVFLFKGNYHTKAKQEKDPATYNFLVLFLTSLSVLPAVLIVQLLPLSDRGMQYLTAGIIAGFLLLVSWKIDKKRLK